MPAEFVLKAKGLHIVDPLWVQHTVEVVHLMLYHPGMETTHPAFHELPLLVVAPVNNFLITGHHAAHTRDTQAALPALGRPFPQRFDLWVDEHGFRDRLGLWITGIFPDREYDHPLTDPDLGGRQAGAVPGRHGVKHVRHKVIQRGCVKLSDGLGNLPQDRMPHTKYCSNGHMRYTIKLNYFNNTLATMKAYNLRILLATSLFFLFLHPTFAEEPIRYYDIEIVVFEALDKPAESNELWPAAKELTIPDNAAILGRKYEGKLPPEYDTRLLFNTLAVKDYQLTRDMESLKASGKYRVLLHTGWRQPGLPKNEAITVYFKHAISSEATENQALQTVPTTTPTTGMETGSGTATTPAAVANLEGLITIVLSRYLHLDVEMLYHKQPKAASVDMFDSSFLEDRRGKEAVYYLQQNRRMRSKETHYIDHPVMSMLVRIMQYEGVISPTPVSKPAPVTKSSKKQ